MALFNLFGKKLKGENKYFKSRVADSNKEEKSDQKKGKSEQPSQSPQPPQPPVRSGSGLVSERFIDKGLLVELLKFMRNHDVNATVTVLANTIDNKTRKAAIMINKGYIPKRIVSYLQNINMRNINDAIKLIQSGQPDEDGFIQVDESEATNLNLPLGCMLLGIFHHLKNEFAVVLVLKNNLKDRKKFLTNLKKLLKR